MARTLPKGRDGEPSRPLSLAGADDAHHAVALGPLAQAELDRRVGSLPAPVPGGVVVRVGRLCREPDLDAACAALRAEVGEGGRLELIEHLRPLGWAGRVHDALDPLWQRLPVGCHVDRDVVAALRRAGFFVTDLERFTMPTPTFVLRRWVQGRAVLAPSVLSPAPA